MRSIIMLDDLESQWFSRVMMIQLLTFSVRLDFSQQCLTMTFTSGLLLIGFTIAFINE